MPTAPTASNGFEFRCNPAAWKALRNRANLATDKALADALGVAQSTVTRSLAPGAAASPTFVGNALGVFTFASFDKLFTVVPATR